MELTGIRNQVYSNSVSAHDSDIMQGQSQLDDKTFIIIWSLITKKCLFTIHTITNTLTLPPYKYPLQAI
jgi:hypothetical protein